MTMGSEHTHLAFFLTEMEERGEGVAIFLMT